MNQKYISIYTDGSCLGNPGKGGWAVIFLLLEKEKNNEKIIHKKIIKGCKSNTTNNVMEMTAMINALKNLKESSKNYPITIYTDSQYVINGLLQWRDSWEFRNFRGVKNKELWLTLYKEYDKIKKLNSSLKINYVKAHQKNPTTIEKFNNEVDSIAREVAKKC